MCFSSFLFSSILISSTEKCDLLNACDCAVCVIQFLFQLNNDNLSGSIIITRIININCRINHINGHTTNISSMLPLDAGYGAACANMIRTHTDSFTAVCLFICFSLSGDVCAIGKWLHKK